MNNKRKSIAKIYDKELNVSKKIPFTSTCVYHLYWICVKNRKFFRKKLLEKGIETGTHYKPIHQMSLYRKKNSEILPITEKISEQVLTLPMYPNMEKDEKDYLIDSISEFFETL